MHVYIYILFACEAMIHLVQDLQVKLLRIPVDLRDG